MLRRTKSSKGTFSVDDIKVTSIKSRVAIITGGSRGIGKATAALLHQHGVKVAIMARPSQELSDAATEIGCLALPCDVSSESQVSKAFERVQKKWGRVDIVVANAGYIQPSAIRDMKLPEWQKHLDVNLTGTFLLARQYLSQKELAGGCFITISSTSGMEGRENWSAYCASKAGVISLAESLAKETAAQGIGVFDIAPSRTDTKMRHELFPDENRQGMNTPEDVAKLVGYCCSEQNTHSSGSLFWIQDRIVTLWKNR